MIELAFPRALAASTLTLALTLAPSAARAEPPAAPAAPAATTPMAPAYAPPAYPLPAYPVSGYPSPLGYANAGNPPDVEYPPEMRVRSSGMIAGGVLLLSFGLVGVVAGSALVGAHEPKQDQNDFSNCFGDICSPVSNQVVLKPGLRTAGIATLVGSVVAMGAGIPLLVIGAKKVPVSDDDAGKAANVTPTLRVGSAGATLTWQF